MSVDLVYKNNFKKLIHCIFNIWLIISEGEKKHLIDFKDKWVNKHRIWSFFSFFFHVIISLFFFKIFDFLLEFFITFFVYSIFNFFNIKFFSLKRVRILKLNTFFLTSVLHRDRKEIFIVYGIFFILKTILFLIFTRKIAKKDFYDIIRRIIITLNICDLFLLFYSLFIINVPVIFLSSNITKKNNNI